MTSANVTLYYIRQDIIDIKTVYQNHLCKDVLRPFLESLEFPEKCTVRSMWADEHEAPHWSKWTQVTEHLDFYKDQDAKHKASWEKMKIKRGKEIQEATGFPLEECITEYVNQRCNAKRATENLLKAKSKVNN